METLQSNAPDSMNSRVKRKKIDPYWLVVMLMSRTFLFVVVQLLFAFLFQLSLYESAAWWPVTATIANVISFMLLKWLLKEEGISYRDLIQFSKSNIIQDIKAAFWVLVVAVVVGFGGIFGVAFLMYGGLPPDHQMTQALPVWAAIISLIVWPLTNALVETPVYMGYCLPRLAGLWKSTYLALTAAAMFLALQHVALPVTNDFTFMLWHFVCMIPLAFVVGILYLKLRRLVPIMIVHYLLDILIVAGIVVASLNL